MLAATGSKSGSISASIRPGVEVGEAKFLPRLGCVLDLEPEFESEPDLDLLFLDLVVLVVAEGLFVEYLEVVNNGGGIGRGSGDSKSDSFWGWKASKKG